MNTDNFEKNDEIAVSKQKNKKESKSKTVITVVGILVLFLIAGIYALSQSFNSSSINISAHFSSVTEGKNPDGSPFDIGEILSDEVLQAASQKLDEKIDVETMRKHLSVSDNASVSDISKVKQAIVDSNNNYTLHPNVYTLTYSVVSDDIKDEGFFASMSAVFKQFSMPSKEKILKSVAESYSEYYAEKYIAGNIAMQTDWSDTDSLDYYNKAEKARETAAKISRFIYRKYNHNSSFVSESGIGYGELYSEIEKILSIDINNYRSFVVQNGLTAEKDSLLRQFAFMEGLYNELNLRHTAAYEIAKAAIDLYDANTTKVVFIPALDEEKTFYMNRTKVGIDYLVEKASSEKIMADEALHNAERYRYLTEHFSSVEPAPEEAYIAADVMYNDIKDKINDFISRADEIITEGSLSVEHEKIETGTPYGDFGLVSMVICGGKMFVLLLLAVFFIVSSIECIVKNTVRKRTAGEE